MFDSPIFQLTIELIIGFFALFLITKVTRKSQINQITPFDFISAIVLGELLGNAIYDEKTSIWFILYALMLWGTLMYIIEFITQKFKGTRKFLEGEPAIIVRNGQIDYKVMKKEKFDINELLSLLRQKDVFSIREIEYAILEQSGNISVLKKYQYMTPTTEDLNLVFKSICLPTTLVLDGEVLTEHLYKIGYDEKWLRNEIDRFGINKIEDVFYADWKQDEGIHVIPRNKTKYL
ncbi:uncharacterized membrane protein YcaP (DUF421 family) [Natranaerovirga pectinivora]|uniref:Uncharacterized membrane protein YcaP (DUF421 family) n=1 Tax=Natranaerovirga pectinivora TaxID=682400 RepID=A0A4R3MN35_9FIRM|nr:DUF421 domain-containing protein [Natranaerovirga pectinivora]TCT15703.1 uncharacterized membrane protein YcaP (DUF421 family) [Natranaerovirga pectinivora]